MIPGYIGNGTMNLYVLSKCVKFANARIENMNVNVEIYES